MTTYRVTGKVISTDPSRLKGDTTTWECDLAAGLELRKTYADGKGTLTQTWEEKRDLLAEMLYTRLNDAGKKVEVTRRGYANDALAHIKMLKTKRANGKNVKSV